MAVVDALRFSRRFLEEERAVACPGSTPPVPDVTEGNHQRECIPQYADNVVAIPDGDMDAVGAVQTDDVVKEARGEATVMTRKQGLMPSMT